MRRVGGVESWASLLAGSVALVVAALAGVATVALAAVGFALLAVGVWRGVRTGITLGSLGLFLAVVLAGTVLPPLPTLLGGLGATVAWDAGHHARELDRQLGRESPSGAVERRHLGYLLVVGAASVGLSYIGYLSVAGSLGPGSAVLLFVGTVALFVAFGREF
ncbi:hypothetical protein [Haloarchaeobius sp. FL176]|uniref:DUF7519 family protein n=1 Tax=Haloarchaeobius sp. FL176 TaxID=2967129 RepID=UPI0021482449|nr:hypothetical protein [Haloarchaeobius sp. FL176]